jgi:FkbM family methyltransferase
LSFVSFAQNFEDVMLWRALRHVEHGFYVDIGAQDPDSDSVSRSFYERGWSGINVEPVPFYADRLRTTRPRDINLQCVVSESPGELPIFVFEGTGLSTLSLSQAVRNREKLGLEFREEKTSARTLRDILEEFQTDAVHWLKVDVEGAEQDVLESWKGSAVLPWIVVVEATLPNESTEVHVLWEPILTEAGYTPVYFDGLNRFYVSREHPELVPAFRAPPNVFDDFTLAAVHRADAAFERAEEFAKALASERSTFQKYAEDLKANLEKVEAYALTLEHDAKAAHLRAASAEEAQRAAVAYAKDLERTLDELGQRVKEATAYARSLEEELVKRSAGTPH